MGRYHNHGISLQQAVLSARCNNPAATVNTAQQQVLFNFKSCSCTPVSPGVSQTTNSSASTRLSISLYSVSMLLLLFEFSIARTYCKINSVVINFGETTLPTFNSSLTSSTRILLILTIFLALATFLHAKIKRDFPHQIRSVQQRHLLPQDLLPLRAYCPLHLHE